MRRHSENFGDMSPRQQEVMDLFLKYGNIPKVAKELGLKPSTAHCHVERVRDALLFENNILMMVAYDRWKYGQRDLLMNETTSPGVPDRVVV